MQNVPTSQNIQKKWIGGNRDSSSVVEKKKNAAFNTTANMNFTQYGISNDAYYNSVVTQSMKGQSKVVDNTIRNAKQRVRSQGYVVPPKVSKQSLLWKL